MLRSVEKILTRVKTFTKRSGWGSGSYESLHDEIPITGNELKMERVKRIGRSRVHCLPDDIPEGYLPVYVGAERKRFVIHTKYLSNQILKELLKRSEEEFGYDHPEGLDIACEPAFFEYLLWFLEINSPAATTTQLQEFLDHFYTVEGIVSCGVGSNEIHLLQM